jgi:hypothetical protein
MSVVRYQVGDRVRLWSNGHNAPMYLRNEVGTVKAIKRTRVLVEFDHETLPRLINHDLLRPKAWMPQEGDKYIPGWRAMLGEAT